MESTSTKLFTTEDKHAAPLSHQHLLPVLCAKHPDSVSGPEASRQRSELETNNSLALSNNMSTNQFSKSLKQICPFVSCHGNDLLYFSLLQRQRFLQFSQPRQCIFTSLHRHLQTNPGNTLKRNLVGMASNFPVIYRFQR